MRHADELWRKTPVSFVFMALQKVGTRARHETEKPHVRSGVTKSNENNPEISNKIHRCLGIDPGSANCGWAVVCKSTPGYRLIAEGLLKTEL